MKINWNLEPDQNLEKLMDESRESLIKIIETEVLLYFLKDCYYAGIITEDEYYQYLGANGIKYECNN